MNKLMTAVAVAALACGVTACGGRTDGDATTAAAATGLSGTWKADPSSAEAENDNSNFVLADGEFTCNSCIPPYSTTANGEWQDVDRPGADQVMIEMVDDQTVKSAFRFEGRDLGNSTWTVSEDGNSMTQEFVNLDGDETTEGSVTLTRVSAGPEGSHAMSGEWELGEYGEISDAGLIFEYSLDGDTLTSSGNDGGWTATFGGEPVAIEGSESGVMVQIERTGDNTHRETFTRDGDTLTFASTDPRDDSKFTFSASRQ